MSTSARLVPRPLPPGDAALPAMLALMRAAFAGMEGRIDPPSSLGRMDLPDLARAAEAGELWALGDPPLAAMLLTPQPGALYLGKLAVDPGRLRQGLARRMVDHAAARAAALGRPVLRLQTRVELTENHATFTALGFTEVARTAHPGYDRPTSITFERPTRRPDTQTI